MNLHTTLGTVAVAALAVWGEESAVGGQAPPSAPANVIVSASGQLPAVADLGLVTTALQAGQKVELRCDVVSSATRPFSPYAATDDGYGHPQGVTVDALVTRPDGTTFTLPAFYHVPYQRQSDPSGREAVGATGPPDWRVRLLPTTPGRYRVRVSMRDGAGSATSGDTSFDVGGTAARGFLRASRVDPRTLAYDNGDDFFPVAEGRQWSPDPARPTLAYAEAFASDAANGVNLTRIWDQNDGYNLSLEGSDPVWKPGWSQFTTALGIEVGNAHGGARAARFSAAAAATEGYFQSVAVFPSTDYELSAYVRTNQIAGGGAVLSARADSYLSPGTVQSTAVQGTQGWTQVRLTFRTGADERVVGIWVGGRNATGTAWFDDVKLSPAGGDYNALGDGDFERHFPKADRGNDPEDPVVNRTVPKGTYVNPWSAFRLDKILEAAEQHGIAVQLCAHGDVYWTWDATVYDTDYARQNGYTVDWTDARHVGYWKRNMRYRIARWGYSPAVLAWEIWNEHGNVPTEGTSRDTELFRFYQQLVPFVTDLDPFDHLVTTSQGSQAYSPEFFVQAGMGVVNYHDYMTTQLARHPVAWTEDAAMFVYQIATDLVRQWPAGAPRLPFVWGEIGTLTVWDQSDPVATTGVGGTISRHNFLWAGAFSPVLTSPIDWQPSPKASSTRGLRAFFSGEHYAASSWSLFSTTDVGGSGITATDPRLRVLALRSSDSTRLLAWLQHRDHTWAKVARDGQTPAAFSASFTGPTLPAGSYAVEWWNTRTGTVTAASDITHSGGPLTVSLAAPLADDVALKVKRR